MKVLFLTHRVPYAPNRGDRIRAYHMLAELSRHAEVDVVAFAHDDDEAAQAGALDGRASSVTVLRLPIWRNRARAVPALFSSRPLTHVLLDAPGIRPRLTDLVSRRRPDVVLAYCSGMARFALEPPLRDLPLIVDLVDVDSVKWESLAQARRRSDPLRWIYAREARTLGRFEAAAAERADATLVVNERERSALRALAPDARIEVVGNGVDLDWWRPSGSPSAAPTLAFCGVMDYEPNTAGALWLACEVWPLVRRRRADAKLLLVGSNPPRSLRELTGQDPTIVVTGEVPDVRPFLWESSVAAAPLLVARGVQNKAIEAVAAGLPVVMTPAVYQGLPAVVQRASIEAAGASAFADAVCALFALTPAERRAVAARADLQGLSWRERLSPLVDLVGSVTA